MAQLFHVVIHFYHSHLQLAGIIRHRFIYGVKFFIGRNFENPRARGTRKGEKSLLRVPLSSVTSKFQPANEPAPGTQSIAQYTSFHPKSTSGYILYKTEPLFVFSTDINMC